MADADDDSEYDQYDRTKAHYILRNFYDLTAHSILTTVKAGIENNCDESTIIRYALDAFKVQMDRISHTLSTTTEQS